MEKNNSELNIANIGDIVTCIDDRKVLKLKLISPPLVYKQDYKVLDIFKCKCDGLAGYSYHVGLYIPVKHQQNFTMCHLCNTVIPGRGFHWACATHFTLKQRYFYESEFQKKDATGKIIVTKKILTELQPLEFTNN